MDKRKKNRISRMYESLVDDRDELLDNTEILIKNIKPHIDCVSNDMNTQIDVDAIIQYQMEVSQLLVDLNLRVLKALKNCCPPQLVCQTSDLRSDHNKTTEHISVDEELEKDIPKYKSQELGEYLKLSKNTKINESGSISAAIESDIYSMKPLDNELLKIICANLANDSGQKSSKLDQLLELSTDVTENLENLDSCDIRNPSPTFSQLSETELSSTVSSVSYQHPLWRIQLNSAEMPKQYDNQDIETLKETFKKFKEKLGVDENVLCAMQEDFHKASSSNYCSDRSLIKKDTDDLESVLICAKKETDDINVNITSEIEHCKSSDQEENADISKNRDSEDIHLDNNQEDNVKINEEKYEDEKHDETKVEIDIPITSKTTNPFLDDNPAQCTTALDKLLSKPRVDRHQEAVQNALDSIPDLRFVPAEPPSIIKNDLTACEERKNGLCHGDKGRQEAPPIKKDKIVNVMYDLKKTVLEDGVIGVFSHIVSPNEFYLQIINDDNGEAMDHINNKMSKNLRGSKNEFVSKEEAFSKLNKYCIGWVTEHKGWFRLQVLDWRLGSISKEVDVQSVDYGFKASVSYAYLRSMFSDVANIPMLAVRCYFPCLYPPGSVYNHRIDDWPEKSIELMKNIANFSGIFGEGEEVKWFRVFVVMRDGDAAAVDLMDLDGQNDISFGEYLIDLGAVVEIVDEYDDPGLAEFLEDVPELENADNINELIIGYDAQDEARICRFTRTDGTCYKGKNCKLEHVPLPKGGFTTDRLPIYHIPIDSLELPVKGQTLPVLITAWKDSCTYLAQVIRNPVEDNGLTMDRDLKDLIAALNHPKMVAEYAPFKVAPAMGEIVVAYNKYSKIWMRAVVRGVEKNEAETPLSAQVYMADFGEIINVKFKELRQIKEQFVRLPFQGIEIYLKNFKHNTDCDIRKAKRFFEKHIVYKNFLAEFRSSGGPWSVNLKTFKGHDIGATLLREKYAVQRDQDLRIKDGYKLQLE